MPADLERDLGLYATVTISIGAMVGSGIFVLPGLAAAKAGPAVVLAYFLAGLIALPAALSKSEMATAMPEAGGTYLYIDRAMGPFAGTIAGLGSWFSLTFKSAFAIVGLGAYLLLFVQLPGPALKMVGIGIALVLLVVNVVGVKQTGRLQATVVTIVLLALIAFIADGIVFVDGARFHPFLEKGSLGLLEATGFVFVSYAGVTKIASVAEEIENPGRNIPAGILVSVVVMMLVYTFVVFVVVGVTPADALGISQTPMALAASQFADGVGLIAVTIVAVLALTSMSNAGILATARFPLAMARDELAPQRLAGVHERFKTPVQALTVTGILLVALIAFFPVERLAKLASAFKIIIFALVNAAVIAFRESDLESYEPEFVAPGYPWVQLAGIIAGLALLPFMGPVSLAGAVGMIIVGAVWYRLYAREKTEREGAALDAIRRSAASSAIDAVEGRLSDTGRSVCIALDADTDPETERRLLALGANIAAYSGGRFHAVKFVDVPDQVPLSRAAEDRGGDPFEGEAAMLADRAGVEATVESVVAHDAPHALRSYLDEHDLDLVLGEWVARRFHGELLGEDVDWYIRRCDADLLFLRDRGEFTDGEVVVMTAGNPFDPLQ
ncbi:MAG: APC family permease, partial [Salinirussus sp.]